VHSVDDALAAHFPQRAVLALSGSPPRFWDVLSGSGTTDSSHAHAWRQRVVRGRYAATISGWLTRAAACCPRMERRAAVAIATSACSGAVNANAQPTPDVALCEQRAAPADRRNDVVGGCTRVIDAGGASGRDVGWALNNRGVALSPWTGRARRAGFRRGDSPQPANYAIAYINRGNAYAFLSQHDPSDRRLSERNTKSIARCRRAERECAGSRADAQRTRSRPARLPRSVARAGRRRCSADTRGYVNFRLGR